MKPELRRYSSIAELLQHWLEVYMPNLEVTERQKLTQLGEKIDVSYVSMKRWTKGVQKFIGRHYFPRFHSVLGIPPEVLSTLNSEGEIYYDISGISEPLYKRVFDVFSIKEKPESIDWMISQVLEKEFLMEKAVCPQEEIEEILRNWIKRSCDKWPMANLIVYDGWGRPSGYLAFLGSENPQIPVIKNQEISFLNGPMRMNPYTVSIETYNEEESQKLLVNKLSGQDNLDYFRSNVNVEKGRIFTVLSFFPTGDCGDLLRSRLMSCILSVDNIEALNFRCSKMWDVKFIAHFINKNRASDNGPAWCTKRYSVVVELQEKLDEIKSSIFPWSVIVPRPLFPEKIRSPKPINLERSYFEGLHSSMCSTITINI